MEHRHKCHDCSVRRNRIGDVICIEGDCKIGRTLIYQMMAYYNSVVLWMVNNHLDRIKEFEGRFKPVRDSIWQSFRNADSGIMLPFSPACCQIKEIGGQAQQLTVEIGQWSNTAVPGGIKLPGPTGDAGSFLTKVAIAGVVIAGVAILGPPLIRAFQKQPAVTSIAVDRESE